MIYKYKRIVGQMCDRKVKRMKEEALTECELLIMRVIWASEEALSLQEIVERVNSVYKKEWKSQTVSVFLGRIVKRGFLTSRRQGRLFFYYPTVTEEEYEKNEIAKCVDFWSGGRADAFIAALARARGLTEVEKRELRRVLDGLDEPDELDKVSDLGGLEDRA